MGASYTPNICSWKYLYTVHIGVWLLFRCDIYSSKYGNTQLMSASTSLTHSLKSRCDLCTYICTKFGQLFQIILSNKHSELSHCDVDEYSRDLCVPGRQVALHGQQEVERLKKHAFSNNGWAGLIQVEQNSVSNVVVMMWAFLLLSFKIKWSTKRTYNTPDKEKFQD